MEPNKPVRVLLVDDEDRFRVTTTATLRRRGLQVKAVGSGIEAIEEMTKGDVDVVVLDVKMPDMDGHETLREIKALKPDVEVIMLTGHGSRHSAVEGWREGVFAYLTKPLSIDFLALRIREAFDKRRGVSGEKRRVRDVMEPLSGFVSTICEGQSVAEAIGAMRQFFATTISATKFKETLLRSILVTDERNRFVGVIGLSDLLRGLQPPCIRLPDDRSAKADCAILDSFDFSDNFATMVCNLALKKVRELMPTTPSTIDANADLIEATNRLLSLRVQSLLVTDGEKAVGVIRDKDLFLEMADIIRERRVKINTL